MHVMTLADFLISNLPLLILLGIAVVSVRRTGVLQTRLHRKKVEDLLGLIARAIETRQT